MYRLARELLERGVAAEGELHAVFVSSPAAAVPVWRQASAREQPEGLVVWDYHVVLLQAQRHDCSKQQQQHDRTKQQLQERQREPQATAEQQRQQPLGAQGARANGSSTSSSSSGEGSALVWDLDTTLPCPVPLGVYAAEALRWGQVTLPPECTR